MMYDQSIQKVSPCKFSKPEMISLCFVLYSTLCIQLYASKLVSDRSMFRERGMLYISNMKCHNNSCGFKAEPLLYKGQVNVFLHHCTLNHHRGRTVESCMGHIKYALNERLKSTEISGYCLCFSPTFSTVSKMGHEYILML